MDEAIKKESETIQYVPKIQPDDANDDVFVPNTSNSTNPENEALPRCENKVQIEERYVSGNKAYEQDEADKIPMDREIISKRITRKSSRLSLLNNKKENLKRTISSKVIKQKRTARKSNKTAKSPINEMLTVLGKKFETESYEKSFRYIQPNNATNALQYIPYGIPYGKQEESHNYSSNTNRNMLQYLDCNNLRQENLKQPILVNSNPWSIVPKSGQNFVLNNISNVQNQVGQASYYNAYTAADYNSKQGENPYFYSSIKSVDSQKLLSMENKVFRCSCNSCTNNLWNNMHTGIEAFPKMNSAFQQIPNNNISSYMPSAASNNFWNAVGSFNYSPNYQTLQADNNFKKLFYSGFNTVNNHLTIPYNNNLNVAQNASVTSESLRLEPSSFLYTGNTSAQFSNYYNKDLTKVDMSVNQYKERDNFNSSAVPIFENALPVINTHGLDSESTNTLSQNSTSTNESGIIYDITNFVSETNTVDRSEQSPFYTYVKEMDKNWQ